MCPMIIQRARGGWRSQRETPRHRDRCSAERAAGRCSEPIEPRPDLVHSTQTPKDHVRRDGGGQSPTQDARATRPGHSPHCLEGASAGLSSEGTHRSVKRRLQPISMALLRRTVANKRKSDALFRSRARTTPKLSLTRRHLRPGTPAAANAAAASTALRASPMRTLSPHFHRRLANPGASIASAPRGSSCPPPVRLQVVEVRRHRDHRVASFSGSKRRMAEARVGRNEPAPLRVRPEQPREPATLGRLALALRGRSHRR